MGPRTTLGLNLKAISRAGDYLPLFLFFTLFLFLHNGGNEIIPGASATTTTSTITTAATAIVGQQKCDKIVEVETKELLSYLGNVTFTVPSPFKGRWTAVIKFTSPYTFIGGWGVEVQSFGRKAYAIFERNENVNLKAGDKVIFQFRVLYGYSAKVPKVLSIKWQNFYICGGPNLHAMPPLKQAVAILNTSSEEDGSVENASSEPSQRTESKAGDVEEKETGGESGNEDAVEEEIRSNIQQQMMATNRLRHVSWKNVEKKD